MKWTNILKNTSYQRSLKKKQITLIDPYLLKKLNLLLQNLLTKKTSGPDSVTVNPTNHRRKM